MKYNILLKRIHCLVWNKTLNAYFSDAKRARARGKKSSRVELTRSATLTNAFLALALLIHMQIAPLGGEVIA